MHTLLSSLLAFTVIWLASANGNEEFQLMSTISHSTANAGTDENFMQQQQQQQISAAQLRLLYSLLMQDRERLQWQPSHFRPIAIPQQKQAEMHEIASPIKRQEARFRRAPAMIEQWGDFYKTMDTMRKPRFG